MKTTVYFKIIALILLTAFKKDAFSQAVYYTVYQAGTTNIVLKPSMPSTATYLIQSADAVEWKNVTKNTVENTLGTADVTIEPSDLDAGVNTYEVRVKSAASGAAACWSDPATLTIYKLPSATIALSPATVPEYCDNVSAASSALTAEVSPASSLPDGVTLTYTWDISKNASSVASTSIGSHAALPTSAPWTDVLTVTTKDQGIYTFSVKAEYSISAAVTTAGGVLKSNYEIPLATTDKKTIKIYPTPSKPNISVL